MKRNILIVFGLAFGLAASTSARQASATPAQPSSAIEPDALADPGGGEGYRFSLTMHFKQQ